MCCEDSILTACNLKVMQEPKPPTETEPRQTVGEPYLRGNCPILTLENVLNSSCCLSNNLGYGYPSGGATRPSKPGGCLPEARFSFLNATLVLLCRHTYLCFY